MTDLVDSYVTWRETALAVQDAYDRWARPASADPDVAFAGYSAALQQEAQAARIYQEQLDRAQGRRLPSQPPAARPWWGFGALGPLREWCVSRRPPRAACRVRAPRADARAQR
jgi:hypothetical protein